MQNTKKIEYELQLAQKLSSKFLFYAPRVNIFLQLNYYYNY